MDGTAVGGGSNPNRNKSYNIKLLKLQQNINLIKIKNSI